MKERLPLRFNRNEIAGAFGDVGTDIPLIIALIVVCKLDTRSVLILFGLCQVFAGLAYRLPVPVQPLKAMAVIAIAGKLSGDVLAAGGLVVGAVMLLLTITGGLTLIARIVPTVVVRGLQFGLGVKLATLALTQYLPDGGVEGYILGGVGFVIIILLRDNRKYPAAAFALGAGFLYMLLAKGGWNVPPRLDLGAPKFAPPSAGSLWTGLLVLAIPQLPLSLGNAVLAAKQTIHDLYPGIPVSVRKLGLTYSCCNLVAPLFGGIPVCHGSGGIAGHHAFGARTGGSAIIYGGTLLICGVLFGGSILPWISAFPKAILGMVLLFEAVALMRLSRDMIGGTEDEFLQVLTVGLLAAMLPYGFCIAIVTGVPLHLWLHWRRRRRNRRGDKPQTETKGNDNV